MSTVHLILQGKGGVGKSVIATLLAQYLKDKGLTVTCFDADPVNSSFAGFPALQVTKVDLIETTEKGRRINPRRFDDLVVKFQQRYQMRRRNSRSEDLCRGARLQFTSRWAPPVSASFAFRRDDRSESP